MISDLLFGLGFVAVVEGLLLALAPGRLMEMLAFLGSLPENTQRSMGLAVTALGVLLVSIGHG